MRSILAADGKALIKRNLEPHSEAATRVCSMKKDVLRNFAKFTGKHMCQRHIFNKVAVLTPATLLKKTEAVAHKCSIKKVSLEISQNSQEITSAKDSFLIKLQA